MKKHFNQLISFLYYKLNPDKVRLSVFIQGLKEIAPKEYFSVYVEYNNHTTGTKVLRFKAYTHSKGFSPLEDNFEEVFKYFKPKEESIREVEVC